MATVDANDKGMKCADLGITGEYARIPVSLHDRFFVWAEP